MKTTTQVVYDLITSETFEYVDRKLSDVINRNSWDIAERNEYSLNELLEDLLLVTAKKRLVVMRVVLKR